MLKSKKKEKIDIRTVGVYARLITLDYGLQDNESLAKLISDTFNVICTTKDLEDYERLHAHYQQIEDFELESRRQEYGLDSGSFIHY